LLIKIGGGFMKKPKMKGVYLKKGYWYARIDGKPFEDQPPFAN